ncbi:hypothetical protein Mp_3g00670 [Marchantia polymorpha subsp. ruderalis]|uniref:Uncharacterized protein n=2 Tax=Marchantia polymorpha TaxID=3197 RepID=A0AAF6AVY6_MARPO|nr:hypothetical protein MARPO_0007s0063 [Marchantia polymorpha]BBN03920.1 hypothetical protein Mp_3g00670 [Marchantia polymorpha subsp. ruderalis]|eukprot:PTQ47609.1 hypothetical protein MARPO_0007s0063 [Marchantia polymorpha]
MGENGEHGAGETTRATVVEEEDKACGHGGVLEESWRCILLSENGESGQDESEAGETLHDEDNVPWSSRSCRSVESALTPSSSSSLCSAHLRWW